MKISFDDKDTSVNQFPDVEMALDTQHDTLALLPASRTIQAPTVEQKVYIWIPQASRKHVYLLWCVQWSHTRSTKDAWRVISCHLGSLSSSQPRLNNQTCRASSQQVLFVLNPPTPKRPSTQSCLITPPCHSHHTGALVPPSIKTQHCVTALLAN